MPALNQMPGPNMRMPQGAMPSQMLYSQPSLQQQMQYQQQQQQFQNRMAFSMQSHVALFDPYRCTPHSLTQFPYNQPDYGLKYFRLLTTFSLKTCMPIIPLKKTVAKSTTCKISSLGGFMLKF